jgi:hypothetical protein
MRTQNTGNASVADSGFTAWRIAYIAFTVRSLAVISPSTRYLDLQDRYVYYQRTVLIDCLLCERAGGSTQTCRNLWVVKFVLTIETSRKI